MAMPNATGPRDVTSSPPLCITRLLPGAVASCWRLSKPASLPAGYRENIRYGISGLLTQAIVRATSVATPGFEDRARVAKCGTEARVANRLAFVYGVPRESRWCCMGGDDGTGGSASRRLAACNHELLSSFSALPRIP